MGKLIIDNAYSIAESWTERYYEVSRKLLSHRGLRGHLNRIIQKGEALSNIICDYFVSKNLILLLCNRNIFVIL